MSKSSESLSDVEKHKGLVFKCISRNLRLLTRITSSRKPGVTEVPRRYDNSLNQC